MINISYIRLRNSSENDRLKISNNNDKKKTKPKKKKKSQSRASIMFFGPNMPSDSSDNEE